MYYRYEAGDHVAVYPVNDPDLVELIGKRLEVDLGQMFTLTNVDGMLMIGTGQYTGIKIHIMIHQLFSAPVVIFLTCTNNYKI